MAHGVQRPHDKLFRTVFADHGEAAALLRAHLPEALARDLRWSTLTLQDGSFVDPDLRDTESDLLFSIRRKAGAPPAWLYVLVEHQVRDWPWVPRFAHLLVDQSRENPQAVRGLLHGRIAQLMMMARYRHRRQALRRAVQLLAELLPHAARRPGCRPYAGGVPVGDTRPRHRAPIRSTVARDDVGIGR